MTTSTRRSRKRKGKTWSTGERQGNQLRAGSRRAPRTGRCAPCPAVGNYGEMFERNLGRQQREPRSSAAPTVCGPMAGCCTPRPSADQERGHGPICRSTLTVAIFIGVIAAIAFDLIDMALATLIGVCLMIALRHPETMATS